MERFNFNLQKVLDFRITIEDKKKNEFVAAQKNLYREQKILEDSISKKNKVIKDAENFRTNFEFQSYVQFIDAVNKKIENQKKRVMICEKELEDKKQELLKAISDRKILEKLKERALQEFNLEQSKKEQRFNDDFALYAYVNRERR
ncbi:hypothetical protein Q428_06040 [Fervidicella metallireducens AeB]|uniref:Flagellar FliJ protein n=1 Tax=Fervidicella metallireducens AeB TaxID=1403537 RepID=A0A017RVM0_9CLOT|nr:flagellar export protein FliJ [Fervidicella metallireducens]EYE88828.1 hypothetical protein Q428_06040 [Fervidicella metallireducens AeB]